jgi:hypothetical protein
VSDKRQSSLSIEVQRSLQGWKQRRECFFEADDGPGLLSYQITATSEEQLQLSKFFLARL